MCGQNVLNSNDIPLRLGISHGEPTKQGPQNERSESETENLRRRDQIFMVFHNAAHASPAAPSDISTFNKSLAALRSALQVHPRQARAHSAHPRDVSTFLQSHADDVTPSFLGKPVVC
jgi:hypothetical protein